MVVKEVTCACVYTHIHTHARVDVGKEVGSSVDWELLSNVRPCLIGLIASDRQAVSPSHLSGVAAPTTWIHRVISQLLLDTFF